MMYYTYTNTHTHNHVRASAIQDLKGAQSLIIITEKNMQLFDMCSGIPCPALISCEFIRLDSVINYICMTVCVDGINYRKRSYVREWAFEVCVWWFVIVSVPSVSVCVCVMLFEFKLSIHSVMIDEAIGIIFRSPVGIRKGGWSWKNV